MIKQRGFSLIELMIAIGLSGFIMIGMVQSYRNAVKMLQNTRNLLVINRRVALFFNQIERDITAGTVYQKPVEYKPVAPKKGEKPKASTQLSRRAANKKQPPPVSSFKMAIHDDAMYRHRNKKWQTTKMVNILCTTPLEVFGNDQERMVRVGYELLPDKKKKGDNSKESYTLWRKQTHELANEKFKNNEDAKEPTVSKHVVAEKIKHFSLQATYIPKPPEQKKGQSPSLSAPEKREPVKTFTWTADKEEKKSSTGLPEYINMHLELWDDEFKKSYSFECMMPCFIRDSMVLPKEDQKKQAEQAKDDKQQADEKQGGEQTAQKDGDKPAGEGKEVVNG